MKQAIYAPVFKCLDQATFTTETKAKILQSASSNCYGTPVFVLCLVVGYELGNPLLIWGKLTNPGNVQALENNQDREEIQSQKPIPIPWKASDRSNQEANVIWLHWFWDSTWKDRLATQHCVGWPVKSLKTEKQFRSSPCAHTILDALLPQLKLQGYGPGQDVCLPCPR